VKASQLLSLVGRGWQPLWSLDVLAALWAGLYVAATRRVTRGWPWRRTLAFLAGIAGVLVALQSGIGAFDDRLLSDHMVQHLLLLELAPLLLLAGRPGILLLRSTSPGGRPALARRLRRLRPLTHPAVCLAIFWLTVGLTHLPAFYDATLRHAALHDAEHVLYLSAGALMWWPILDGDPFPGRRLNGFGRLAYVIVAMLPMTLLGGYLDREMAVVYSGYAAPARTLGISAVTDQQQAGAIMWVLGSSLMVVCGLWQAMAALIAEERRLQVRERLADGVLDGAHEP
jgi:putative copper resistance protein D